MNNEAVWRYIDQKWNDHVIPTLIDYIRIPNKSPAFDPQWKDHGYMHDAVNLICSSIPNLGVKNANVRIVELENRTPLLLVDIAGTGNGNVLLYGHYDKQPEFEGWREGLGPWTPVIANGRLYGRGGADDGYALFSALTSIAALQEQQLPIPRCLVLIEGCEESGSFDLPYYIDALKDTIGVPDLVVTLDAECGNYDQLWMTTSLRGMVSGTLRVGVLEEGVHSGAAGGIVPSSFRILRNLLDRVENSQTGLFIDALSVDTPPEVIDQASQVAETLGTSVVDKFPWSGQTNPDSQDIAQLLLNNTWSTSLAVVGLGGAPSLANAGNTLRPGTEAKLVFRLPPTLDAQAAGDVIKQTLERDVPHNATVSFDIDGAETGWYAPPLAEWVSQSLDRASRDWFDEPFRQMGCGGTIPFMNMLGKSFPNCQFAVTGVLGPHSNAHGPNEFLDLATAKRVTCCVASLLRDLALRDE